MAETVDIAIIGGGLAGLSLAILAAEAGYRTVVIEQKDYPFHRVCGEYIAMESWDFLGRLGLDLAAQELPRITRLQVTTPTRSLQAPLKPGGFGISRYALDAQLARRAESVGVILQTRTRAHGLKAHAEYMCLHTSQGELRARVVGGAFGKWSNLDTALRPQSLPAHTGAVRYVGIKYHLKTRFPQDLIALHNFAGGYGGISAIEDGRVCFCYLVEQQALQAAGSIEALEAQVLSQNPYLRSLLNHAERCWSAPQTIAQVYFSERPWPGSSRFFLLGDAAGLIPPLCGNGMSMAFRSAHLLFPLWQAHFEGRLSLTQVQAQYQACWRQSFGTRLDTGRALQRTFGKLWPINALVQGLAPFPGLVQSLITRTHGTPF